MSRHCHVPHAKGQISSETSSILFLDILSGTTIKKPKFSSLEKNHLPAEINHIPKKISDSVEEVEIQKGKIQLVIKVKCLNAFSFSFLVVEIIVTWKLEEIYLYRGQLFQNPKLKISRTCCSAANGSGYCVCRGANKKIWVSLGQLLHDIHSTLSMIFQCY